MHKMTSVGLLLLLVVASGSALYAPGDHVVELTPSNFRAKVLTTRELWIVEFYAPWCGHCKAFAPEWKKAASALQGIVKVGAVDAETHKGLASDYKVEGYPTVFFFGDNKYRSEKYNGERTAKDVVEFAMSQATKITVARLTPKKREKEDPRKKAQRERQGHTDIIQVMDGNFRREVLEEEGMVMVQFVTPWCAECRDIMSQWIDAATELKGKVKICYVDYNYAKNTASRYGVKSFPTVKVFLAGRKNREPIDYDGAHTTEGIVEWAFETMAANIPVSDVLEITGAELLRKHCKNRTLCVISVFPQLLDCQSSCRNNYISTLQRLAEKFKKYQWGWLWTEAGAQASLEESLEVGGFGYPALAALNGKKMKYSVLRGQYSEKGISEFLRDLSYGKGSTFSLKNQHILPKIEPRQPWDGQDAEMPAEEDVDLSDGKLDDKDKRKSEL